MWSNICSHWILNQTMVHLTDGGSDCFRANHFRALCKTSLSGGQCCCPLSWPFHVLHSILEPKPKSPAFGFVMRLVNSSCSATLRSLFGMLPGPFPMAGECANTQSAGAKMFIVFNELVSAAAKMTDPDAVPVCNSSPKKQVAPFCLGRDLSTFAATRGGGLHHNVSFLFNIAP